MKADSKRDANGIRDYYTNTIESTVERLRDGTLKPWTLHTAPDGSRVKPGRLTAPALPTELQDWRAVIIDESILFRVANTAWLPKAAFDLPRPTPFMTKGPIYELDPSGRRGYGLSIGGEVPCSSTSTACSN